MRSDIGLFHQQASGRLVSRFTNDIGLLRNSFTSVLTAIAKGTLTTAFLTGIMFYQNAQARRHRAYRLPHRHPSVDPPGQAHA